MPEAKANAQMFSSYGAIVGSLVGPLIGGKFGRRPAFFVMCLGSLLVCKTLFRSFDHYSDALIATVFFAGLFTAAFYGWFPLYLPELFPTRVRATGQGVSYNTGRVFAAFGAILSGQLVRSFEGSYAQMGSVITLIYVVGMAAIWLAPETKGKPLPE
jgi:MFS family permease